MLNLIRYALYAVILAFLALAAVGMAYIKFDLWWNYAPVTATVLDFAKLCRPLSSHSDLQATFDATPEFKGGKLGPCEGLVPLHLSENVFEMSGRNISLRVEREWRTHVRYVSPADGQTHESFVYLGPKDGDSLESGRSLTLLANTHDPALLQEP